MLVLVIKQLFFRNRVRMTISSCITVLLTLCMAFYAENIQTSQITLLNLKYQLPVRVYITNLSGDKKSNLFINGIDIDALINAEVRDLQCTAIAAGSFSSKAQEQSPFLGGDTKILAANCVEATGISEEFFSFTDYTYNNDFFKSVNAICVLNADYAKDNNLMIGDMVTLPIYLYIPSLGYEPLKEASIKIVGTYVTKKENAVPDMLVPVNWLREEAVRAGLKYFVYTSCNAIVDNPLKLHEFKTHMIEIGFVPIDPVIDDYATGKGLIIDDELFVKAARELRQNINLLSNMYIPFCTLIIGITSLTMFLIIHNTRHDIALANSLGVSKWYIIVGIFIGLISLNTLGCTTTLLILWTTLHVSTFSVFVVFKMFMFCVVISVVIVLLILRRMRLYDLINMY